MFRVLRLSKALVTDHGYIPRSITQINGECSCGGRGLHVITEADIRAREDGVLGCLKQGLDNGARGFLLLSMDVDLTAPLVSQATSFSCALGPPWTSSSTSW